MIPIEPIRIMRAINSVSTESGERLKSSAMQIAVSNIDATIFMINLLVSLHLKGELRGTASVNSYT